MFKLFNYRVTGDGNCLFTACSVAIIGHESLATYLRCLTSIELFRSADYYASHPSIFGFLFNGEEINENNVFSIMISNAGLQLLSEK